MHGFSHRPLIYLLAEHIILVNIKLKMSKTSFVKSLHTVDGTFTDLHIIQHVVNSGCTPQSTPSQRRQHRHDCMRDGGDRDGGDKTTQSRIQPMQLHITARFFVSSYMPTRPLNHYGNRLATRLE